MPTDGVHLIMLTTMAGTMDITMAGTMEANIHLHIGEKSFVEAGIPGV